MIVVSFDFLGFALRWYRSGANERGDGLNEEGMAVLNERGREKVRFTYCI